MKFQVMSFPKLQVGSLNLLEQERNAQDNLVLQQQTAELYKTDYGSITLKPGFDTQNLVADVDISHVDLPQTLLTRHLDLLNSLRDKTRILESSTC